MHVGMSTVFQSANCDLPDHQVYQNEVHLADLAEPLGYQSIWGVEHHFTDYTMCPDPIQYLSYMAGRTEHVQLGTMVVVLPWHDPMRVAEEVSMLDNLSNGRMILGIGRGLARVEYQGFRLDMSESRTRFVESAEMLLGGLETGFCEFHGEFINQPKAAIRPAPLNSFKGRTFAAAVSPESSQIMAELGVGLLIIPQKPWDDVVTELESYREVYRRVNREEPPAPIVVGFTYCDEDPARAEEMARRHVGAYWESVMEHYEIRNDHFKGLKGYEYYNNMTEKVAQYGDDDVREFFMNLQVWGTPEQCLEKIERIHERVGHGSYVAVFSYGGMPYADAEASMRLFAEKVMPRLKEIEPAPAGA